MPSHAQPSDAFTPPGSPKPDLPVADSEAVLALERALPAPILSRLRSNRPIAILTGAGISAESGIPTFRDSAEGMWSNFNPEEVASRSGFRRDPEMVWNWYRTRHYAMQAAEPNDGHRSLAWLVEHHPSASLITQNIDGLHQRAGAEHVIELHGNIGRVKCFDAGHPLADETVDEERPPNCPICGSLARPDVVWFGEQLDQMVISSALDALWNCGAFFSIGTSAMVEPAASLAFEARERGAYIIEINLELTPLSHYADLTLEGPAGQILPALFRAIWRDN